MSYSPEHYEGERAIFQRLKSEIKEPVKQDYEKGVKELVAQYSTSLRENRFIVGGVLKVLTLGLLRSCDFNVRFTDENDFGGDFVVTNDKGEIKKLAVRGVYSNYGRCNVINYQGGEREWSVATLFALGGIGVVYVDRSMFEDSDFIKSDKSALALRRKAINRVASDQSFVLPIQIATKPVGSNSRKKPSYIIAEEIIEESELSSLSEFLPEFKP